MKKYHFVFLFVFAIGLSGCDKVKNAYPAGIATELDPTIYPGDFSEYVYPTFIANTNTNRNVLIEDFTGHKCIFCAPAADIAHSIEQANPDRVYVSSVHSDPTGVVTSGSFQSTSSPYYTYDFTNPVSLQIGGHFGSIPGSGFFGNPSGNISRVPNGSGSISFGAGGWTNATNSLISANDLKVNIQSVLNYFPTTNGAYIHIEVDPLVPLTNELRLVVAFYEDSIVKPQKDNTQGDILDYIHRDLLKLHINGDMFGQKIDDAHKDANGKYYYNYSFKIPTVNTAENSHILIYVFDKVTHEVYQVIKKKFI